MSFQYPLEIPCSQIFNFFINDTQDESEAQAFSEEFYRALEWKMELVKWNEL